MNQLLLFTMNIIAFADPLEEAKVHVAQHNLPAAIYTLRIAGNLQPHLEAARDAVAYPPVTNAQERLRPTPPSKWKRYTGPEERLLLGVVFTALACVAWSFYLTTKPRCSRGLGIVFSILVILILTWELLPTPIETVAVVKTPAIARNGNAESYSPAFDFILPEGTELILLHERGGWWKVQVAGGATAWVPEECLIR